jgi:hypothetical protein
VEWAQWLKSRLEAYGREGTWREAVGVCDEMGLNTSLPPMYASLRERTMGVVLGATQTRA